MELSGTIWDYLRPSRTIVTIFVYLRIYQTIWDYLGLSWSIWDYLGLSWTILDHLGLSGTISDYLGLYPEAIARPYNFETFCVTYTDTHTDR